MSSPFSQTWLPSKNASSYESRYSLIAKWKKRVVPEQSDEEGTDGFQARIREVMLCPLRPDSRYELPGLYMYL